MKRKADDHGGRDFSRRDVLHILLGGAGAWMLGRGAAHAQPDISLTERAEGWSELSAKLRSPISLRSDSGYAATQAAMQWNGRKVARYPDAILTVSDEREIQEVVRFARSRGLKISARGRGHHWCAASLHDGGILLDLSQLRELSIDAANRIAHAQPSVTNVELSAQLSPLGLAFPFGHCPSVPLSGYLLGGGFGWNSGSWGPACFSVTGVDLVTADGDLIHASEQENPDYFWAARGGGPAFPGIVTRYHFRLFDQPRAIRTSTVTFALNDLDRVLAWLPEVSAAMPPQVELTCLFTFPPPSPDAATGPAEKVLVVMATAFAGSEEEAREWLQPLEGGPAVDAVHKDLCADTPMEALFGMMNAVFPAGKRYATDVFWSNSTPAEAIASVKSTVLAAPSPRSIFMFVMVPPPPPGLAMPDVAYSMGGAMFLGAFAGWEAPEDDQANRAWVREIAGKLEPFTVGHYVGETDLTADANRPSRCYSPAAWQRLLELNRTLDPSAVFHSFPA